MLKRENTFESRMLDLTSKMSKYLGKEGVKKILETEEQSQEFKTIAERFAGECYDDCFVDRVAQAASVAVTEKTVQATADAIKKTVAMEISNNTLMAYRNYRWWGDVVSRAVIGTGTMVIGAVFVSKLLKQPSLRTDNFTNVNNTNPFGGTGYTASPRPITGSSARGVSTEPRENLH